METLSDRAIIFIGCVLILLLKPITITSVIVLLIALSVSALNLFYEESHYVKILCIIYAVLCVAEPLFSMFLPLIFYDTIMSKDYFISGLLGVLLLRYFTNKEAIDIFFLLFLLILSYLLMMKTKRNTTLLTEYKKLRDTSKELSLLLESKNRDLIEKQDYEIHLATLKERNRIAREIHDNVGHLLSRTILMLGAIISLNKDKKLDDSLETIKITLSDAMDNVRQSVHDLHDESIDLETEIKRLINDFCFCEITYEYDMELVGNRILKYCFLAIIKEALSNVMKHSNATKVHIIVREHPGIYQLLIHDNGTIKTKSKEEGIGIVNMKERISSLKGTIYISTENGFRIFISVPNQGVV